MYCPAVSDATLAQLVAAVNATNNHPTTGIIGTKWLPEAVSKLGRSDVALDMVLQTGAPSWMDQIAHNATTVWENWEYFAGPNMNSHNHPALTSIGAWMWRWIAGIRIAEEPSEPGYGEAHRQVTLAPYDTIVKDHMRISSVDCSLSVTHGNIQLAWEFSGSVLYINTTLPPNTVATIKLPSSFDRSWAQLQEGESIVYTIDNKRTTETTIDGIHTVYRVGDKHLAIHIGSGSYQFVARLG